MRFGMVAELGAHHALFQLSLDIRKAIYTTNSVESLNWSLRKIIKTRGGFVNEDAVLNCYFLRFVKQRRRGRCLKP